MGFFENLFRYAPALEFALTKWFGDRATWRYIILMVVLSILTAIGVLAAIAIPIMGPLISGAQPNLVAIISALPQMLGLMFAILVIGSLASGYVNSLVVIRALQVAGYTPPKFGAYKYLRLIVLDILVMIFSLFSIKRPKWLGLLAIAIIALVLIAAYPGNLLLLAAALIAGGIYEVLVIYNSLRLVFSTTILLNGNAGVLECAKTSETITKGNVWGMVAVLFVFGVFSAIVQIALGMSMQPFASQLPQMILSGGLVSAALIWLATTLVSLCVTMVFVAIANFLNVGLFQLVSGEHKGSPP